MSTNNEELSEKVLSHFGRGFELTEYMSSLITEATGGSVQSREMDIKTIIAKLTTKRKAIDGVLETVVAQQMELERELNDLEKELALSPIEAVKTIEETSTTVATLQTEISAIKRQYAAPGHKIHRLETEITNMDRTKLLSELFAEILLTTSAAMIGRTAMEQGQLVMDRSKKASALPFPILEYLRVPSTMPQAIQLLTLLSEASKSKGTLEVTIGDGDITTTTITSSSSSNSLLPNLPSSITRFVHRPGAFPRQEEEISKLTERDWRAEELTNFIQLTWLYIEKVTGYIRHSLLSSAGPQQQQQQQAQKPQQQMSGSLDINVVPSVSNVSKDTRPSQMDTFGCDDIMATIPTPPPCLPNTSNIAPSDCPSLILRLRLLALCFSHSTETLVKLSRAVARRLLVDVEQRINDLAILDNTHLKEDLSRLIVDSISQLSVATTQALTMCCDIFQDARDAFEVYLGELDGVVGHLITRVMQALTKGNISSYKVRDTLRKLRMELGSLYSRLIGARATGRNVSDIDKEGIELQNLLRPKLSEITKKTFLGKLSISPDLMLDGMTRVRSIEIDSDTANKHYKIAYDTLMKTLDSTQAPSSLSTITTTGRSIPIKPEDIFISDLKSFFDKMDKKNPLITLPIPSSQQCDIQIPSLHSVLPLYDEDKKEIFKDLLVSHLSESIRTFQDFYCPVLDQPSDPFVFFSSQFEMILNVLLERAGRTFENGLDFLSKLTSAKLGSLSHSGYLSEAGDAPDFFGIGNYYKGLKGNPGFVERLTKPTRFDVPLANLTLDACVFLMAQIQMIRSYFSEVLKPLIPSKIYAGLSQLLDSKFLFNVSQKISILLQNYCDVVCASVACILYTTHTQSCFQEAENGIPSDVPACWVAAFIEKQLKMLEDKNVPEETRHHIKHNIAGRLSTLFILDICRFDISLDGGFHLIPYFNRLSELLVKSFESPDLAELLKAIGSLYVADKDKIKNFLCSTSDSDTQSAVSYFWDRLMQNKEDLRFLRALLKARRDMKKMKEDEFTSLLREIHNASG